MSKASNEQVLDDTMWSAVQMFETELNPSVPPDNQDEVETKLPSKEGRSIAESTRDQDPSRGRRRSRSHHRRSRSYSRPRRRSRSRSRSKREIEKQIKEMKKSFDKREKELKDVIK